MRILLLSFLSTGGLMLLGCDGDIKLSEEENRVSAYQSGQLLWTYQHDPSEGKPWFHPLVSTDGVLFTDNRPKDHPWHRGVWFSWKFINGLNYWEENPDTGKSEGETRIVRVARHIAQGDEARGHQAPIARFNLEIEYGPADTQEVVMTENRQITVSPPEESGAYTIDWSGTFQALDRDVVLDRTPPADQPGGKSWGGYAGWSVRMNKDVKGGVFLNSHGDRGADRQPADWMLYQAPGRGCLLFLEHPDNLNYPAKWYLHEEMPYFGPAVIHDGPHTLKAGTSLSLRYRLVVAPGTLDKDDADKAWKDWTSADNESIIDHPSQTRK